MSPVPLHADQFLIVLGATLASTRFVQSQLFGLSSSDPVAIGVALAAIVLVTVIAGYVPGTARREDGTRCWHFATSDYDRAQAARSPSVRIPSLREPWASGPSPAIFR